MASPRIQPPPTLAEHLSRNAVGGAVLQVVVALLVAALATSRAEAHVLSPLALASIVAGSAATGVVVGWPTGLFLGARDVLTGRTRVTCAPGCTTEPRIDPFGSRELHRTTTTWMVVVGLWAGAGGALLIAALGGKRASFLVAFVGLAGLAGLAGVVVDTAARHRGAHAVRWRPVSPVRLRRRAWRQLALPVGATQAVVNGLMTWVLFHSYDRLHGRHSLTAASALADVALISILLACIFGAVSALWGETDAALGRVVLDDPDHQIVTRRSPIGWQGFVYIVVAGVGLGRVATYVLPGHPGLIEVAVARGAIGGVLAFLATGAGYVRGALNNRLVTR